MKEGDELLTNDPSVPGIEGFQGARLPVLEEELINLLWLVICLIKIRAKNKT